MLKLHRLQLRGSKARICTGFIGLMLVLSAVSGCVIGEKARKESVDAGSTGVAGSAVTRFEGGQEGFVIRETPNMAAAWRGDFERAIAMMKEGDSARAIGLLEKVVERSPGVTAPYIDLAMAYAQIGKVEQAEQNLKTALNIVPDHPVASNEYGLLLRKAGRFAEARTIYEKTLATFPEYLPAHKNLGILCELYLKDLTCAIEQYEIYSEALPEDEQIRMWIADLSMRLGR